MSQRDLTLAEARVLGVLVEKQSTVPDTYPLSLNALAAGCNQKTARDPVMNLSETEVLAALEGLREQHLVNEVSGTRVTRYEHNAARGLGVPGAAAALLAVLALRGPQTAAELRANTERLHRFADTGSVEAFLDELMSKTPPRVIKLPRAPGGREPRWAHLLCGEANVPAVAVGTGPLPPLPASATPAVSAEDFAALQAEVAALRTLVQRMAAELGMEPGPGNA